MPAISAAQTNRNGEQTRVGSLETLDQSTLSVIDAYEREKAAREPAALDVIATVITPFFERITSGEKSLLQRFINAQPADRPTWTS